MNLDVFLPNRLQIKNDYKIKYILAVFFKTDNYFLV